jgi:hypothetical protein
MFHTEESISTYILVDQRSNEQCGVRDYKRRGETTRNCRQKIYENFTTARSGTSLSGIKLIPQKRTRKERKNSSTRTQATSNSTE